jgi:hypothetical protein
MSFVGQFQNGISLVDSQILKMKFIFIFGFVFFNFSTP